MEFAKSDALTFGLELEFQIINQATGLLSPSSLEIWKNLADHEDIARFSLEATLSTMEINSSIHTSADAMYEEIETLAVHIREIAQTMGLDIRGGGTQMAQFWNDRIMAPTDHAQELESKSGFLPNRFSTYGMHVHIGMPSGDDSSRIGNVLQAMSPLFIVMAAASPFLQLADTGFAAARPLETLMYPHGGPMPELRDWAHFEEVCDEVFATDLANSLKDIYWDVRPKPEFGTVEVRVFDTPLSIKKAVAMAAFTRACASMALDGHWRLSPKPPPATAQRVSRFLACKNGMDGTLYNPFAAEWMPARIWMAQIFEAAKHQPTYAADASHLEYLETQMCQKQDHEVMRAAWAEIQAQKPNLEDMKWCLSRYSHAVCQLLT